ncbi:hypothetical protein NM688_g5546 [Phlebia brevispora]|uniref:Uncharacterized protein n=1 Tax=Phlebia brevispora TaxID=194682 RepID=A0ACC1SU40_9APHY|nr:hypothetical protein NM688_g5546 [Phlebia brevispora]
MSAPSISAVIAAYEESLTVNYCVYATLVIVCYEHLITIASEYELLWQRKWTGATWLFVVNRYILLASVVTQVTPVNAQPQTCENAPLRYFTSLIFLLPIFISAAFSALRVFALLDRAYITAGCTLFLGLAPLGILLYENVYVAYYYVNDSVLGSSCYAIGLLTRPVAFGAKGLAVSIAITVTTISADLIAIVITWLKTYRHVRQAATVGVDVSFGGVLLRYGILYFSVICVLNILQFLAAAIPSSRVSNPLITFVEIIPSIVVSRFLINLRESGDSPTPSSASKSSRFSTLNFQSHASTLPGVLGNLGEPLADGGDMLDPEEGSGAEFSKDYYDDSYSHRDSEETWDISYGGGDSSEKAHMDLA